MLWSLDWVSNECPATLLLLTRIIQATDMPLGWLFWESMWLLAYFSIFRQDISSLDLCVAQSSMSVPFFALPPPRPLKTLREFVCSRDGGSRDATLCYSVGHTHTQTVACTNCQRVSVHIRIQQAPLLTQQFSVGHCWELWSRLPPKLMWRCRCGKLMPQWCKLPRSCRFLGCCLSGGEWIPPLRSEVGQRDEPVQPGWEEPGLCASGSLRVSCSHNVKDIDSHDSLFNRPHSNQMCACSSPRNC